MWRYKYILVILYGAWIDETSFWELLMDEPRWTTTTPALCQGDLLLHKKTCYELQELATLWVLLCFHCELCRLHGDWRNNDELPHHFHQEWLHGEHQGQAYHSTSTLWPNLRLSRTRVRPILPYGLIVCAYALGRITSIFLGAWFDFRRSEERRVGKEC